MVGINTGLYIGYSGLQAARGGLLVTGNNIANVHTEGYSRQAANLVPGITLYEGSRVLFGSGATIQSVSAMRDRLVEKELRENTTRLAYHRDLNSLLRSTQAMLQDGEGSGLGPDLGRLFQSLQKASATPDQLAYRSEVLEAGSQVARTIRSQYQALDEQNKGVNQQVAHQVEQINQLTSTIAALNRQIGATPGQAPSLVDERNAAVNRLAELIDIQVYELDNDLVQVNASSLNALLVGRESSFDLITQTNPANLNYYDVLVDQGASSTNLTSSIQGGSLGALLQARDVDNRQALRELDNLAAGLIDGFNAIHATGFAMDGVTTGLNFFTPFPTGAPGPDNHFGAASAISLSVDVAGLPQNLALSSTGAIGDNGVGLLLAQLRASPSVIDNDGDGVAETGSYEAFHALRLTNLGAKIASSGSAQENQQILLEQAQNRRDEISGVSLDEEAMNLSQFQKAFEANSRFLRMIDQLMGQIIADLG